MSGQLSFNPVDYGFQFTPDGWYKFDSAAAHKAAMKARNARAKELRAAGYQVRAFTLGSQLISMGGIGSGRPHIEVVVSAYYLNYR